jgi:hypothetical protein
MPGTQPKKSYRGLFIALAIVLVVLVILGGGGVFAYNAYTAPGVAAQKFCTDLKAQDYDAAYGMLSSTLTAKYTASQFKQASAVLDQAEGQVSACARGTGSNAYGYSLGSSTASVSAVLSREKQGLLQGAMHLKNENGAWKVDAIDTSLLGVNLGALQSAATFCASLQSKDYATAYGLLGGSLQTAAGTQSDFVAAGQLHETIDGAVTACGLTAIDQGNTDAQTSLSVSLTFAKLGAKSGKMALQASGDAWKISDLDAALLGTDLGPYKVGLLFCADLKKNDQAAIYRMTSSSFMARFSQSSFVQGNTLPAGIVVSSCTLDVSTYKVTGSNASVNYSYRLTATSTGQFFEGISEAFFVREGTTWKIDGFKTVK